ncbi:hypothetical protein P4I92_29315, partial [Bacillus cereus]
IFSSLPFLEASGYIPTFNKSVTKGMKPPIQLNTEIASSTPCVPPLNLIFIINSLYHTTQWDYFNM